MLIRKREIRTSHKRILGAGLFISALCLSVFLLIVFKILTINPYFVSEYALHGVDVSHYQGEINWKKLENQGFDFAFIKATEGSRYLDKRFAANWQAAKETDMYIGAYHFFSFDSAGQTQADWYIQTIGELNGKLAPVVDVEYYGDKEIHPPKKEQVTRELHAFLQIVEEHYQIRPMIYTTYHAYHRYIEGEFNEYPLWIRNVYYPPDLDMRGKWQFWQYTDRAVLEGYKGEEKYMDLNVFGGTEEEFEDYIVSSGF